MPKASDTLKTTTNQEHLPETTGIKDHNILLACQQAAVTACHSIAPVWPLDQSIAVNPYHQRTNRPIRAVAARMAVLGGIRLFPGRAYFRQAWEEGRIHIRDLEQAIELVRADPSLTQANDDMRAQACIEALNHEPSLPRLPLLMDVLDDDPRRHTRLGWRQAITHQISQTCAAYFDQDQADWQPQREAGLYEFWRETLIRDHGIGTLMGLPDLGQATRSIPANDSSALTQVIERVGLPESVWADYFEAVLLTVNGWASWCAYLGWQAKLQGQVDHHLEQLLAIRLAWGPLMLECKSVDSSRHAFAAMRSQWQHANDLLLQVEHTLRIDEIWQTALDLGYQRKLSGKLCAPMPTNAPLSSAEQLRFQAVFCIDVRSEPLRRAIESLNPEARTIGFAGFFGLPIEYAPAGTQTRRPQLPGLFAPAMTVTDRVVPPRSAGQSSQSGHQTDLLESRQRNFAGQQPWQAASHWPSAAFSFVETMGLAYVGKLSQWLSPSSQKNPRQDDLKGVPVRYRPIVRPMLTGLDQPTKVQLAAKLIKAMGLTRPDDIVLLVGHESQSANNAHACTLDCGACGGQSGQVNARALALLLNDPAVRRDLASEGLDIPAQTAFVAAVHNTTTDEIDVFDLDLLDPSTQEQCQQVLKRLALASSKVRAQRAPELDLASHTEDTDLLEALRQRANDGAQTRPEWGLAGNAALIFAPRHLTRHANLEGRTFLHDYDPCADPDGSTLEFLMTGPLLVAYWINWQYHASMCDPEHMGSGNKVLHNVVGGRIGVFEGNGGDLRIGLSTQSLHDGVNWRHEPVRLTVVIDAPRERIDAIIKRHRNVADLLDHHWIHLWQRETNGSLRQYRPGMGSPTWLKLDR